MDLAVVSRYIEAMTKVLKDITPQSIQSVQQGSADIHVRKPADVPTDSLSGRNINVSV